jgi:uncharacterized protein YecT (DUF1311 family)
MRYRLLLSVLFAIMPVALAQADDCDNAADQQAMSECVGKSYKKADADLNGLYKQIAQRLKSDPDTTKLLVAAQRAWVSFRDAECTFSASTSQGGTIYPMVYASCLDGLTEKRIADLKAYLACQEGDTSCPVPAK